MLFVEYSSTFNKVLLHKLTDKLLNLVLKPTLCDWLLDFLIARPQSVRIGNLTKDYTVMNTGTGTCKSVSSTQCFTHCSPITHLV